MKDERVPTKAFQEERRTHGRPRGRWKDVVDEDATRILKCKNWRRSVEDRDFWRQRTEEAKAKIGLQRHRRRRDTIHRCNSIQSRSIYM
jgi:hypothetical protein